MSVSRADRKRLQANVSALSHQELLDTKAEAERFLRDRCVSSEFMSGRPHTKADMDYAHSVIEGLTLVEARLEGKGWLYRLSRRSQLVRQFFLP